MKIRVFISVELPIEIKDKISGLIKKLETAKAAVKWVSSQNLHVTLKFLGWVEDKNLEPIIRLTEKAVKGSGNFKVSFANLGTFPEKGSPRVVWVGTDKGGNGLCKLAKGLEESFASAGYRGEEREFKPHLTIGRVKENKGVDKLKTQISKIKNQNFGEVAVDKIYVMKSTLSPKGPIYEIIKEVKL